MTAPARVDIVDAARGQTWLRVVMREGRKRQIREVAGMLGHHVKYLQRVRIGPIRLTNLKVGEWRHLSASEVKLLQALIEPRTAKRSTNTRMGAGSTKKVASARSTKTPNSRRRPTSTRMRRR